MSSVLAPLDVPLPDRCTFPLKRPLGLGPLGLFVKVLLSCYIAAAGAVVIPGVVANFLGDRALDRFTALLERHWRLGALAIPVLALAIVRKTVTRHWRDVASLRHARGRELACDRHGFRLAHAFVSPNFGPVDADWLVVAWEDVASWDLIRREEEGFFATFHHIRLGDGRTLVLDRKAFVDSDRFFLEFARRHLTVPIRLHGLESF